MKLTVSIEAAKGEGRLDESDSLRVKTETPQMVIRGEKSELD